MHKVKTEPGMAEHQRFMQRCLDLAALGLGETSPNPMVGAVVVYEGNIIGEGYHHRCGEAHAEVNAIASVQDMETLKESTLYVSLEPCNHRGRTPACTDLILRVGIPRVVVAIQDPCPKVNGSGLERLRENGVEVIVGVLQKEAEFQNRRFLTFHNSKSPYIILKWAQSSDACLDILREIPSTLFSKNIAYPTKAIRISNVQSRDWVHRWRSEEDAILVGSRTALLDDPALTVRVWDGKNPIRMVLDSCLRIPVDRILFTDHSALTWVITDENVYPVAVEKFADFKHVRVFGLDFSDSQNAKDGAIQQLLQLMYTHNIQSVLIEGGAQILQSFLNAGCWDEIRVFRAAETIMQLYHAQQSTSESQDEQVEGLKAPNLDHLQPQDCISLEDNELWVYYNTCFNLSK